VQSDQPSPEPGTAQGPAAPGSRAQGRTRRRANRMAFASAAAGLLAIAVIAAGTALASAGAHQAKGAHQATSTGTGKRAAAQRYRAVLAHEPKALQRLTKHKLLLLRRAKQRAGQQAASAQSPAPGRPYGAVIRTGIQNKPGELVFYAVHVHVKQLPGTTFGIMGGYQDSAGHLSGVVETNETSGSDVSEGFHAIEAPINSIPEFGYYAGPAAKITGTVGGQTIQASLAHWSVNPKVVIFWFSPADDPSGQDVTSLAAFDAQGKPLPPGNSGVGHG
jgi:hypothetical protein